ASALTASHHRPTRIPAALGYALTPCNDLAGSAGSTSGARHGGRAFGTTRAIKRDGRGRDRADWRRTAVRRGSDAASVGTRRAGRCPGDSAHAAAIIDGTARPAWPGARGSADRCPYRARLFLSPSSRPDRHGGRAAADGAGTARRGRHLACARTTAGI